MAYRKVSLGDVTVAAATGASAVFGIGDIRDATVTVTNASSLTWTISLSHDGGTTWATYATGTGNGVIVPTQTAGTERLPRAGHIKYTLASGTGTVKMRLGGFDENAVG